MSITTSAAITNTTAAATASRSILGPLLTTYTPSGICTNYGGSTNDFVAYQAQGCSGGVLVDTATCWPPANTPAPNPPFFGWGFYSPGTVCPSGYASACGAGFASDASSATSTSIPDFDFEYPLIAGETAVGCCPIDFTCSGGSSGPQTCASTVTSGSYLAGYCPVTNAAVTDSLTSFQYITVPGTNTITFATNTVTDTLTGTLTTAVLLGPLFQINWQATDRPVTSTSKSATSSSSLTTAGSSPTPPPAVDITPTPSPSSGLSTGAKVAIGVVIPIVVLAAAGALGFWLLRRRRRDQAPSTEPGTMATSQYTQEPKPPIPPSKRSELDAASPRPELATPHPELVGDGPQFVPHELAS